VGTVDRFRTLCPPHRSTVPTCSKSYGKVCCYHHICQNFNHIDRSVEHNLYITVYSLVCSQHQTRSNKTQRFADCCFGFRFPTEFDNVRGSCFLLEVFTFFCARCVASSSSCRLMGVSVKIFVSPRFRGAELAGVSRHRSTVPTMGTVDR
jgi:hypothetical protein